MVDFRLWIEPQWGSSIVNQQSKINNQKLSADHEPCGDGRLGRPAKACPEPAEGAKPSGAQGHKP
jgi:hypothetical protein